MPEVHFVVRWPSGAEERCYSPSTIILEHLEVGTSYTVTEFLQRTRAALDAASERVRARYGYACSSALDQLRAIEERILEMPAAERAQAVTVLAFERHAGRDARRSSEVRQLRSETLPVIVIGGGHAGLAMSYCLRQAGVEHVVLEAESVAHSWQNKRWDTFCLVTPNWQCTLPGHPYDGPDAEGFMLKEQIVDYVQRYARKYQLPVREGVRVHALSSVAADQQASGGFVLETSSGSLRAEQVVVATGAYHLPFIPDSARGFPAHVQHLHSESYKNPGALPEGAVMVVGSGQSGVQIAEDLQLAGRQVHLCVGSAPRCARRYRGRDVTAWLDLMGYYDIPYDAHPDRDQVRDKTNHYVTGRDGGHDIDLRAFACAGMKLYGTLLDAKDGIARFAADLGENLDDADDVYRRINASIDQFIEKQGIEAPPGEPYVAPWHPDQPALTLDLAAAGVSAVVWSIGFRSDFSWVHCPVLDERGHVRHDRGKTEVPGLYFLGLPWLYSWGSGRFFGVGRDAEHLLQSILARAGQHSAPTDLRSQLSP